MNITSALGDAVIRCEQPDGQLNRQCLLDRKIIIDMQASISSVKKFFCGGWKLARFHHKSCHKIKRAEIFFSRTETIAVLSAASCKKTPFLVQLVNFLADFVITLEGNVFTYFVYSTQKLGLKISHSFKRQNTFNSKKSHL